MPEDSEEAESGTTRLKRKPKEGANMTVNPIALGQRSRQLFNDVWTRVNQLGGIMRSSPVDEDIDRVLVREN